MNRNSEESTTANFFSVVRREQSYLNILYLLLAFPLGVFYFVFLVTGISVGVGLIIIWVGIPILLLVLAAWYGLVAFERLMAIALLHVDVPPMTYEVPAENGLWARLKTTLKNPVTWKGLAYLLLKFPLGTISFVLAVTLIAVSAGLILAPFTYQLYDINGLAAIGLGHWAVDTLNEALIAMVVGLGLALLSLHVMNGMSRLWGQLSIAMLGGNAASPTTKVEATPIETEANV